MKTQLLKALVVVIMLLLPIINFAQAPPLGTAANFVLFTTVGAVGNTGISQITGNVGTNSGSITGFGNVNGVMCAAGSGQSAQCAADLLIAYNQLNSTVPTFFPAPLLGNGQMLVAGVYSISGAATLNLDLILDAQGNPNAVFIFQIQGPFSTGANSKVKLINGALACNVFWKVEGLVSMAAGTTMRGTVIANNAAINMSAGDTLEGRALSTTGAVNVLGVMAYTPIGCGSPVLSGPAAPALGSSQCYTLFSSNGPVSNAGITHVTGDVGTNVGLTTGFNPLFVTGTIHPIPDGSTAQCATDLGVAYTYLNAMPYDIELLYPAQFGHNLVLTPHAYLMNAATTFTDTLFLNALGNANAVFVIKINGALSTSTYSKVVLINGAQAKNIYWKVDGAVSINDNSVFCGTIVCNNGAILLNTGVSLEGRALSTTGALSTSAITANMPAGCGGTTSPVITAQPISQAVCNGGSASFSVAATGTGLTYQWRKGTLNMANGGNISGASTATLSINPVNLTDAVTNYNVVITGTYDPAVTSTSVSLTVNALPVPTITGPATPLVNSTGNIYATETGMTGYAWTVSAGGIITAGSTSNAITVTWNTVGANNVTVNYVNSNTCTAVTPTVYNVTVTPLIPTITGSGSVCQGVTGVVYTTEAGKTGYVWTITAGGTITSGSGSNSILVTWNNTGAQSVGVTYTNSTATLYPVTVNVLPLPTISGAGTVCQGASAVYTTQAGMTGYAWIVPAGGTITAGGTSTSNTVTVVWTTAGAKTVSVNYLNASLCTSLSSGSLNVTVNTIPVPTIGSTNNPCVGSTNNIYYSESGMTGYVWTVSTGGTMVSGQGTSTLNVTWTQLGTQTVSVNYLNAAGCMASVPTVYTVFVNSPPNAAGAITGTSAICAGTNGVTYSTTPIVGVTSYSWTVPAGATLISGSGTTGITVDFGAAAVSGNITVAGTNLCGNGPASTFAVVVNPIPAAAGTISGPASVCAGATGVAYSVSTIANATAYVWTVPAGATITAGASTKNIVVTFGQYAGTGAFTVKGTNNCGNGTVSPGLSVVIHDIPANPVVTVTGNVLTSSSITGNQWYYNNTLIPGAITQTYTVTNNTGSYWCVVTLDGCASGTSNKIWIEIVGTQELPVSSYFTIYPVPNNGQFTASISSPVDETFTITVYDQVGGKLLDLRDLKTVGGKFETVIDLRPAPNGMYLIVFMNSQFKVVKKFYVNQ